MNERRRSDPGNKQQQQQQSYDDDDKFSFNYNKIPSDLTTPNTVYSTSHPQLVVINTSLFTNDGEEYGGACVGGGQPVGGFTQRPRSASPPTAQSRWLSCAQSLQISSLPVGMRNRYERGDTAGVDCGGGLGDGPTLLGASSAQPLESAELCERTRSLFLCPPELPRRRRSLSVECSRLEVISEEAGSGGGAGGLGLPQRVARRYSVGVTITGNTDADAGAAE